MCLVLKPNPSPPTYIDETINHDPYTYKNMLMTIKKRKILAGLDDAEPKK